MKNILICTFLVALICSCSPRQTADKAFIHVNSEGQFVRNGRPYYYVGTNFWYGAILGSEGQGGNRERLHRELDYLKSIGVDNLRVLVGADGENGVKTRVEPSLQVAPGVYNDTILAGLDYFMNELRKRDMTAVLYLNNSWEWSGGYSVYLQWSGHGKAVVPAIDGWPAYMEYVKQFHQSDSAKALFARYVKDIITRTNRYNQIRYVDDPTIMAWQIGNEPRAFSEENKEPFARWMAEVAAQIKSLDPNHMVSSGSEGSWGCENDIALYERIHADSNIDYLNIHIWPYNWSWVKADSLQELLPQAQENTRKYIDEHLALARKYRKPVVLEEFGFPRDGFKFSKKSTTTARDAYYAYIFELIRQAREQGDLFAGCNFWGWGGFAEQTPGHVYWERGDDYTGDPAQEEQGLNSVFATDASTVALIKHENERLKGAETIATLPRLKVVGTHLMNELGDTVALKGVSYGWHSLWPRFYNEQSARHLIQDWNARLLRASIGVGINDLSVLKRPQYGKECATKVVDAAIKYGAYVIIDWHSHSIETEAAKAFFAQMATRYKGVPNVIYEIFNEPVEDSWEEVKAYAVEVIKTIRAIEPDAVILVGSPHWDQDIHLAADAPIEGFDNLMYTLHFYANTHGQWLRDRGDYALSKGLPLFVSECAGMEASGDGPLNPEEWDNWVKWMEEHQISWAAWSLSDKHETCSMLLPSVTSEGPWADEDIKEWGQMVRADLK